MKEVVRTAAIVPRGILRDGSFKSPERFEPAMIPIIFVLLRFNYMSKKIQIIS
jgi:hypothetical protein